MNRASTISAAALLAFAAFAPSSANAAGLPSYASLPEVRVPDMLHPKDAPESIAQTDQSKQIRIERQTFGGDRSFLMVHGEEGRCVTLGSAPPGTAPSGNGTAHFRGSSGSIPLRLERLVASGAGEASLEIADGWLDVVSNGVRIETTTRVELARLAKGPADIAVYGFRSGGKLHVVLPAKNGVMSYVDEGGSLGNTSCGHARLTLDPSSKGGSMIVAAGRAKLSGKSAPTRPMMKQARDAAPQVPQVQVQQRFGGGDRMRAFQVSVSTSRTARDKEPLLSVTVGWAEEEPPLGANPDDVGIEEPIRDEPPMHPSRQIDFGDFGDD